MVADGIGISQTRGIRSPPPDSCSPGLTEGRDSTGCDHAMLHVISYGSSVTPQSGPRGGGRGEARVTVSERC